MKIKCTCQHCTEQIFFEPEYKGQTTICPQCQMETRLYVPNVAPAAAPALAQASGVNGGVVVAGWICAFVFPLIGFIIGIYLMSNKQVGRGLAIMITSVVFAGFCAAMFVLLSASQ
jgi:hypothetical protein